MLPFVAVAVPFPLVLKKQLWGRTGTGLPITHVYPGCPLDPGTVVHYDIIIICTSTYMNITRANVFTGKLVNEVELGVSNGGVCT